MVNSVSRNRQLQRFSLPLLASLAGIAFELCSERALAQSPPIFENATVSPSFSPDPVILRGISGGQFPAREISGRAETATGPCVGFMDSSPDHTLTLTSFFDFLSIEVNSSEDTDTTMTVKGPGGAWCNDDITGKNPGIGGQWQEGTYEIWIGSYQKDKYFPYTLRITQIR
ncbi:hypothetical protein [Oscillatoria sp. FACHB-1406]|uniref:hypothetical protein n=1 Tax=Oscillatoria sp. FACHB-1406 TaxID=2692846 RepID=UPI0016888C6B|nr:hypothetical protein [Oscillatoria sp. FACHB-1406]MBD2578317.1 hypothetical protein [Oscillatoria sp. FACHB-1406]